jgi:hypothetical protein
VEDRRTCGGPHAGPDAAAVWDTFAAMGVVRRFAVAGLDEAARQTGRPRGLAVGAIDETGQVTAGELTAGVKRQYLGACVLRVRSSFRLALASGVTLTCGQAAARLGRRGREVRSAGTGSKGQRWYARAWLGTGPPRHHLLIRRHLHNGELAFHYCYLPDGQPASPSRPIRAAGLRWPTEEDFESARTASGSTSPRSASTPPSPGPPCWSWPPRPSALSPPPCPAAAPTPRHPPRRSRTSPNLPSPA